MMPSARLLMFWDYDTEWGCDADRARGLRPAADRGELEFRHTERLLELHADFALPACFAVVGAAATPGERPYHDPDQIRRLHAAGHEIASHTFRHEWLPGLSLEALRETLRLSREALETCIGAPVTSFVPPYNQPFDHLPALSFSRSERRAVPRDRVDLRALCRALGETGYAFCRVSYRPLSLRIADRVARRQVDRPARLERIAGVTCCRLNTPGGFTGETLAMLDQVAARGGIAVVYGHPHSLSADNRQHERWLVPFLARARALHDAGRLDVVRPRDLTAAGVPA
jgi:peptidoglycan/xylan/chitin deacetylase (PgdA/CDA1 family)